MAHEVKITDEELVQWVESLYNVGDVSPLELKQWYDSYQYQGFNRKETLLTMMKIVPDKKEATQIIITCALRGPRRAAETKLISGRTISSYGIPASGTKGTKGISCQRIMAATADLAAYYLKVLKVPKRLSVECPAFLQFPSAGAITMNNELRALHIEFSKKFSTVIGGVFNEQIYQTMMLNSYLKSSLHLFDTIEIGLIQPPSVSTSYLSDSSAPKVSPPQPTPAPKRDKDKPP